MVLWPWLKVLRTCCATPQHKRGKLLERALRVKLVKLNAHELASVIRPGATAHRPTATANANAMKALRNQNLLPTEFVPLKACRISRPASDRASPGSEPENETPRLISPGWTALFGKASWVSV